MSMINEELQKQQDKDIGAAMRKVFGEDTPTIDANQINEQERIAAEKAALLAKERLRALQSKLVE